MKAVFIQPERCVGCKQCEAACAVAHSRSQDPFTALFETPPPRPRIHVEPGLFLNTAFPNKCRHCDPAPCQAVCPTGAISRAADWPEIVLIEASKCIACGMCAMVCPFDVITFHAPQDVPYRRIVALKCDNCIERQQQGLIPACVEVCKANALLFGEINELVKVARTRLAETVSVAVSQIQPVEGLGLPDNVEGWKAWGRDVARMNA